MRVRGNKKSKIMDQPVEPSTVLSTEPESPPIAVVEIPIGDGLYFCLSPQCPGYTYRASDQPHPPDTCGGILNGENAGPILAAIGKRAVEALGVNESNVGTQDMPPLDDAALEREAPGFDEELPALDSPANHDEQLDDKSREELFAHYEGMRDQSPEAPSVQESTPEPELPSPKEAILPRLVTDSVSKEVFLRASTSGVKIPVVGSCWAQHWDPRYEAWSEHCYDVLGINGEQGFALCDLHQDGHSYQVLVHLGFFVNGDLDPYLTRPRFFLGFERQVSRAGGVFPVLRETSKRGLRECPTLNTYVPMTGSYWLNPYLGEFYCVLEINDRIDDERTLRVMARYYPKDKPPSVLQVGLWPFISGELLFFPNEVPEWVARGTALIQNYQRACLEFVSTSQTVPVSDVAGTESPASTDPIGQVAQHCNELALELGVDPMAVVRLFDGALTTFKSIVTMKELAASSPVVAAFLGWIKGPDAPMYLMKLMGTFTADVAARLETYVNQDLEPRIDAIEKKIGTGDDNEQAESSRGYVDVIATQLLDEIQKLKVEVFGPLPEETKAPKRAAKPPSKPVKQPKQPELPHMPAKRGRGRPAGTTVAAGARPPLRKKAKSKPRPASDMASRNEISARPKNKAKPIAAKKPTTIYARFAGLMGKDKNPKILALLRLIPQGKVDKFLNQAQKGLPDMAVTPWTNKEKGIFAQWYYSAPHG